MKIYFIFIILIFSFFLVAQGEINYEKKIYTQMLLLKTKVESNPVLWQDTREGYLRNRVARVCDIALDSLGIVSSEKIIDLYYTELDSLMVKIRDGKEFDVLLEPKRKNYQINYFYSSSRP